MTALWCKHRTVSKDVLRSKITPQMLFYTILHIMSTNNNFRGIYMDSDLIQIGIFVIIIALIGLIVYIKNKLWNEPRAKIKALEALDKENSDLLKQNNSFKTENQLFQKEIKLNKKQIQSLQKEIDDLNFQLKHLLKKQLNLSNVFDTNSNSNEELLKILSIITKDKAYKASEEILLLRDRVSFLESAESNLTAIPYMAQIVADYETYGLEKLAQQLNWGLDAQRLTKVKSIREIRADAKAMVEKNKEAQYQLAYLLELYPVLKDVIECDFKQLPIIKVNELSNYDATKDYLSKEEYQSLSTIERNQLALDRYKNSHNKSKWQIGRDYELYIGYRYSLKGYDIDYFGSYMGLEDLGRDIIAKKDDITLIIQCKYWSSKKQIHEKHITQLYGTMVSYCIENNLKKNKVKGLLITNIELSDMAKKMAIFLNIEYKENVKKGDYPCIKCNIGHSGNDTTKIYHLPFDQQYDSTKINKKGEFYAMTVEEAESAGFRRAFKWFST